MHNIRPANKGQCIVLPKRHIENIRDLNSDELSELFMTVQGISKKLNDYLKPIGFNYGFNEGYYAGQRVKHFHFHIIPRIDGDYDRLPEYHLFHRDPNTKKDLTESEIEWYISTPEPFDKAGAYAIQGLGTFLVRRINGSYTNVVGLPVCEVIEQLIRVKAISDRGKIKKGRRDGVERDNSRGREQN